MHDDQWKKNSQAKQQNKTPLNKTKQKQQNITKQRTEQNQIKQPIWTKKQNETKIAIRCMAIPVR